VNTDDSVSTHIKPVNPSVIFIKLARRRLRTPRKQPAAGMRRLRCERRDQREPEEEPEEEPEVDTEEDTEEDTKEDTQVGHQVGHQAGHQAGHHRAGVGLPEYTP